MNDRDKLYINGRWVSAQGRETIEVVNPATEQVLGKIPAGTATDAAAAVEAARGAFEQWASTPWSARVLLLAKLHQGLATRSEEIANVISREMGMPLKLSRRIQAGLPALVMESFVRLTENYPFEERIGNSLVIKEPAGVAVCITPWNYPLHQVVAKVAPALAAGCTVVLKPSELAPGSAFILAEIAHEAGIPPGVFNLVTGTGEIVGESLVSHPDIDLVSFTGSKHAGSRVAELASRGVKRVTLELGGKSASLILEDADLVAAVKGTVAACFVNSGQTCNALTRMLVPESLYDEAARLAAEAATSYTVGDPFDERTKLGPLVSAQQLERVREHIRRGIAEGAKLICGGPEPPEGMERGYFVRPTLFGRVDAGMSVAREEIFGPVLAITAYRDEEDGLRIANDSDYGLGGAVWSGDRERAVKAARRIRTGQVEINGASFNVLAPFGGCKHSGYGRELGRYGLEEFLEIKSIQLKE